MESSIAAHERLVTKLESDSRLSDEDREAVRQLPFTVKDLPRGVDIVRDGDRPAECCLVVSGLVCRYKLLLGGKRQILSFHLAGEIPDLQSLFLKRMDHSLAAITPVRAAFIPHAALRALVGSRPSVAAILWRETLIDAAIFREWIVGLGRRTAMQRVAHLLCELAVRFRAVGLAGDHHYTLPVTQSELGDAVGISNIHVSRVLRDLRDAGLVLVSGGTVTTLNWDGLVELSEFDPDYLHLTRPEP
ncbi:Crp/Fnr family transcriptional regulator [Rhizobiales bacterium L72]|uniref:Crp/Fnr family transcriptional regulator n=1 Tax=Propylenella binzhouense TaxID=2555902 RepID=A0A964T1I5_9HYPH|nr:Crp/Fnr family transcriptional regulator [Propylenella binzhouense]